MKYRPLGQSGIEASVVGLGTWAIGGWMWGGTEEEASIAAICASIDAGINLIDTAPAYGQGLSEEIVGKAIRGRRDKVVIATKCGLVWHVQGKGTHHFDAWGTSIFKYLGPEAVRHEVEESLRRLQVDVIDLYQTHWQDETTPIEDTMAELLALKDEGKIRAIGASNATVEQLERYRSVGPLDVDQELYSMLDRKLDDEQLPYCLEHSIAVLAYSPLAQGLLTGAIGPDRVFPEDDQRSWKPRFSVENRRRAVGLVEDLRPIAEKYSLTLAQLAIAWTVSRPGLTHALVGARDTAQAVENAGAGDVTLTPEEMTQIETSLAKHQVH